MNKMSNSELSNDKYRTPLKLDKKAINITIDGLNVLGIAGNHWAIRCNRCLDLPLNRCNHARWDALVNLLRIFHQISTQTSKELALTTVIRHTRFMDEDEGAHSYLRVISRLSRIVILSDVRDFGCAKDSEVDDYVVMALAKISRGYFVSHDYRMQEHIGEDDVWASSRRITMSFDEMTQGISLNIPDGELKEAYEIAREGKPPDAIPEDDDAIPEDSRRDGKFFQATNCLCCGMKIDSMGRMESHYANTGHPWFRGHEQIDWSNLSSLAPPSQVVSEDGESEIGEGGGIEFITVEDEDGGSYEGQWKSTNQEHLSREESLNSLNGLLG